MSPPLEAFACGDMLPAPPRCRWGGMLDDGDRFDGAWAWAYATVGSFVSLAGDLAVTVAVEQSGLVEAQCTVLIKKESGMR